MDLHSHPRSPYPRRRHPGHQDSFFPSSFLLSSSCRNFPNQYRRHRLRGELPSHLFFFFFFLPKLSRSMSSTLALSSASKTTFFFSFFSFTGASSSTGAGAVSSSAPSPPSGSNG